MLRLRLPPVAENSTHATGLTETRRHDSCHGFIAKAPTLTRAHTEGLCLRPEAFDLGWSRIKTD